MSSYQCKVYVVQKADGDGRLYGEVLAVKLTYQSAHEIAKARAPAKVTCVIADKTPDLNGPDHTVSHRYCS